MPPGLATHDEEAQRSLERRALRNVRTLVDKLEGEEHKQSRLTLRFVVVSVLVALAAAIALFVLMTGQPKKQPPVVSKPAAPATINR
jgi:hypothetical protein